jgi:hypothetical protein
MAEIVEAHDLTMPLQDGWAVDYRIRREDGEELHAEVRCWERAHAAAEQATNTDALAAIADRVARLHSTTRSSWSHRRHAARC